MEDNIRMKTNKEKGTPLTKSVLDLVLPYWTYSPSQGSCKFLALLKERCASVQETARNIYPWVELQNDKLVKTNALVETYERRWNEKKGKVVSEGKDGERGVEQKVIGLCLLEFSLKILVWFDPPEFYQIKVIKTQRERDRKRWVQNFKWKETTAIINVLGLP